MQAISGIALIAAIMAFDADAQPAQTPVPPSSAAPSPSSAAPQVGTVRGPESLAQPPAPPTLAPLSQDFQAAMASSQLQTYRYNQLTEQALALRKLCDTGFGPADICPKRTPDSSDGAPAAAGDRSTELPIVAEITGAGPTLRAVLVLRDGRRVSVRPGSALPDGSTVTGISSEDVRVSLGAGRQDAILTFDESAGER